MDTSDKPASDTRSSIQVISRAADILRSLKNQDEGLSLGQIAKRVGLPRSTVQRIVGALQAEHFVIAASPGRGIRLGPELSVLAESARIDIGDTLRPYLVELARQTSETVDLAVLRGNRLIFVDQIPGTQRLRTVSFVGQSFPLCDTANGKACLAQLDDTQVAKLFAAEKGAEAVKAGGLDRLMKELAAIRKTGIAYDRDQHTDGISAVGAAFADRLGGLYAISIPTPSARFHEREAELVERLKEMMDKISRLEVVAPDQEA